MCTMTAPASAAEALKMLQTSVGYLADIDAAQMPAEALAQCVQGMEQADAVGAVAWARLLASLDALSVPDGGGDLRTRPQRYHDALEEAMR